MSNEVEAEKVQKAFEKFKDLLTEREQEVIMRFYGIQPHVRNSLAEIGERFKVTRERIRQIKTIALIKLKVKK